MDRLYEQRSPLLPILPPEESHFFIPYIILILQSPDPARALGVSAQLQAQIVNTTARHALEDAILEAYHRLELHEDALPLAQDWVLTRLPHSETALGYYVLGSHHFRARAYETALDTALQPIVFSSALPPQTSCPIATHWRLAPHTSSETERTLRHSTGRCACATSNGHPMTHSYDLT